MLVYLRSYLNAGGEKVGVNEKLVLEREVKVYKQLVEKKLKLCHG
jgi:hypothetical protein